MHVLDKKYQRDTLLPLYQKHARYLLRVLRTAIVNSDIDIPSFIEKIPIFISVATCHEVAINASTGYELETHQNSLGCEAEYTSHPAARKVGRDLRVKIIWELVQAELLADPNLANFEPYPLEKINNLFEEFITCPYCRTQIYRIYERDECVDYHADGTMNIRRDLASEYLDHGCYHLIAIDDDFAFHEFSVLEELRQNLHDYDLYDVIDDLRDAGVEIEIIDDRTYFSNYTTFYFAKSPRDVKLGIFAMINADKTNGGD